ncbi:non-specific lipid-transfer protein 1-like [Cornus florida]|uniref:non-specific lipid-transfer protein 1-like n=1 Tax=Cornus florida TaxID=4283 RepID=UPI00289F71DE|nr:non-specific lipid-transfer protein 1-like [Cornus florida]
MASSAMLKVACVVVVLMCMVVTAPQAEAAVTCGTVVTSLTPCLGYLRSGGPVPAPCCSGVKSLYNAASTPTDRQTACRCMKSAATAVPGINMANASGLPGKCGVNIPYKISLSTDCSKVH